MHNQPSTDDDTTAMPAAMTGRELLQRTFRPAEMQAIVASLFGGAVNSARIPTMVTSAVKSDRTIQRMISRSGIDIGRLVTKLNALPPPVLLAMQQAMSLYRAMSNTEMVGPDKLPSLATLRRLGLVKSTGAAAWGLAVVQLADWRVCEMVLRQDPKRLGIDGLPYSLDDAASGLVELVRSLLDGEVVPNEREVAFGLIRLIALHTGLRYFRLEERNNCAVVEIPREHLLEDLYRGELGGLVMEGINAPEMSAA
jgi:hypothetical protein